MALGGGTFTSQNKELPGAYINFVSAASASAALSDRGIATMPLELDWGVEGEVFEVTNEDFQKNSLKLFGYAFDSPKMLGLNDLFMGAKTLYAYRLNGGGDKAANTYATAKYCGVRGNDLKIVIQKNADDASKYDVTTYFGTVKVDTQTVIDQLGNDDAVLFNTKYLGVVPNNASGRTSLWSDLVKIRTQLQELGAIEGFTDSDVTVAQGDSKKAVVITSAITVVNAMGKLYETVTVA